MITVLVGFVVTSTLTSVALGWLLARIRRRAADYRRQNINGQASRALWFLQRLVVVRLAAALLMLAGGVVGLLGGTGGGWLLALIPPLFLLATILDLRDTW